MQSLLFGIIAALAWGLHDFMVRNVSQTGAGGTAFVRDSCDRGRGTCPAVFDLWRLGAHGSPGDRSRSIGRCGLCGCPGRVVQGLFHRSGAAGGPDCRGLSDAVFCSLAVFQGQTVGALQWLAVLAVVFGIAMVARASGEIGGSPRRGAAIGWAIVGALGFAGTFALGQLAAQYGSELPASLVTRFGALAMVIGWLIGTRTGLGDARPFLKWLVVMGCLDVTALTCVFSAGTFANPEYASVVSSVFGMVTILLAWRFLHEAMRPMQWLGVLVVFAGIGLLAAG